MSKTAIVTGGATGIGAAVSSLLCREGYNVVIAYNKSEQAAKALQNELSLLGEVSIFQFDITCSESVDNLIKFTLNKYGRIDLLVNNAGIAQQKLFTDISDLDWNEMISTNLSGQFYCCRAVIPALVSQKSGCIINISSMWGLVGASCEAHYSATKAGIIGLTKSLAKELGPSNIRVNCVAPGVIKTDMLKSFTDDDLKGLADETPLMRLGRPEDVANAVIFLASDKASFITGQTLSVDGGFVI